MGVSVLAWHQTPSTYAPSFSLITIANWTKHKERLLQESRKWTLVGWLWKGVKLSEVIAQGWIFHFCFFPIWLFPNRNPWSWSATAVAKLKVSKTPRNIPCLWSEEGGKWGSQGWGVRGEPRGENWRGACQYSQYESMQVSGSALSSGRF